MRILLAQINPIIGDFKGNCEKMLRAIEHAKGQSIQLIAFPELALCGYPPEDFLLLPDFTEEAQLHLEEIIKASQSISVIVGLPRRNTKGSGKPLYNSAAIISDGKLLGFQDKTLLPTYDVFDETRYFEANASEPKLWPLAGLNVAVTICEDIWQHSKLLKGENYCRDPIVDLAALKPDLLINISASPYHLEKYHSRYSVCATAAAAINCPVVLCNQVGSNDSLIFDGHSLYVSADGKLLGYALGFAEELYTIDLSAAAEPTSFAAPPLQGLCQALILGIRDYFFKQRFNKACIGLSGGIDSALVAYLAVEALGNENITGLSMPSRFSSPGSIDDAVLLAKNLQIPLHQISIEKPFAAFLDILEPHFSGLPHDVAEENLQARIRGALLMAFSNKFGYLVLSTGNKSELGIGYSTLYGDMCGGLSVIGDLTKGQVYALARWINRHGEIIPKNSIEKPPSAELRPNQRDSDSLPDYALLDTVIEAYVEEHRSAEEIATQYDYPLHQVQEIIGRIHASEYKRRQGAPCLRVTPKALSAGRRFPIAQQFA